MALSTRYQICVNRAEFKVGPNEESTRGSLDGAKGEVARFRELYPDAKLIFVRQYLRGSGSSFRVLHQLTVSNGSTAEERRAKACAEILGSESKKENVWVG
jgi:hypothetical protein